MSLCRLRARLSNAGSPDRPVQPEPRGGAFPGCGRNGQLDCVDEATNTTVFLRILESQRLLRRHEVGQPVTRASFSFDWPHSTATVTERGSGRAYGIDSWFYDNGEDAVVVPLDQWLAGWSPG